MTTTPDLYPSQFHHYLTRNLRYVLGLVQAAGPVLNEEVRGQALHTLSYALQVTAVWPLTRELFITLAPKLEQGGQREHWIPYLQEALRQSEALGDGAAAGECHFQLALLYRLMSHFAAAHKHLQAALAHFTALNARRDQARVLNELAWLKHLQHRYDEASRHVEQALSLLDEDDLERGMSYRVQGMIALYESRFVQAEIHHRQALGLFELHQDQRKIAWGLQNLAYTLYTQKNYKESIELYAESVEILHRNGDLHHFAVVLFNLGLAYSGSNDWVRAIECYKQAEKIFYLVNDKLRLSRLYTDLGLDYFALKDYNNAEVSFIKSSQFSEILKDEGWRLNAMDGLAMTYLALKNYERAESILKEAIKALSEAKVLANYQYLYDSLHLHWREVKEAQAVSKHIA